MADPAIVPESYRVVPDFFSRAAELRGEYDAHFAEPGAATARHFNWNYWHVPNLYTYLRSDPLAVFSPELFQVFLTRLSEWATETLGLTVVTRPFLSLYVHGCEQALHNDSANGQRGWVYSLTRWDASSFDGGETLLFDELTDYVRSPRQAREGAGFCRRIPPRFNQLLVFDDRVIHSVARVHGSLDPLRGRVVLHGHLRPGPPAVTGKLSREEAVAVVEEGYSRLETRLARHDGCQGVIALRLAVARGGEVTGTRVLTAGLRPTTRDGSDDVTVTREVVRWAERLRFPRGPAKVTLSVDVAESD